MRGTAVTFHGQRKRIALLVLGLMAIGLPACAKGPVMTFKTNQWPDPKITSVEHDRPEGAHPKETVNVTLQGDPGLRASASLPGLVSTMQLREDPDTPGTYSGAVTIPENKEGRYNLTGRLDTSAGRFATMAGPSLEVTAPEVVPPPPTVIPQKLQTIYFDFDKYDLRPDALATLKKNYDWLQSNPGQRLRLEGYCDERGTPEYNMALGDKRSHAAKEYLVSLGVDPDRLLTVSYGEENPVDPGHDEAAWARNRRVEFVPVK